MVLEEAVGHDSASRNGRLKLERLSLGRGTTPAEIEQAIETIVEAVAAQQS